MDLALAEGIAAWNCWLQSEKVMWTAGSLAEGLAEAETLAAELEVVAGGVGRLVEVQAALASSAAPATRADRRVRRRVDCTR
jgi:hypothetical protein